VGLSPLSAARLPVKAPVPALPTVVNNSASSSGAADRRPLAEDAKLDAANERVSHYSLLSGR